MYNVNIIQSVKPEIMHLIKVNLSVISVYDAGLDIDVTCCVLLIKKVYYLISCNISNLFLCYHTSVPYPSLFIMSGPLRPLSRVV